MTCPEIAAVVLCLAAAVPAQSASYAIHAPYGGSFAGLPLQAGAISFNERGWNEIIDEHRVSLMCTYALNGSDNIPDSLHALHKHSMRDPAVEQYVART